MFLPLKRTRSSVYSSLYPISHEFIQDSKDVLCSGRIAYRAHPSAEFYQLYVEEYSNCKCNSKTPTDAPGIGLDLLAIYQRCFTDSEQVILDIFIANNFSGEVS